MGKNQKRQWPHILTGLLALMFFITAVPVSHAEADQEHRRVVEQKEVVENVGDEAEYVEYEYNTDNLLIKKIYGIEKNGEKHKRLSYFYDYYPNGMLRTIRMDGTIPEEEYEVHYDAYGHFMDSDTNSLNLRGVPTGTDAVNVTRSYDNQGNLIRYEMTENERSIIRDYQYDEKNRIARVTGTEEYPGTNQSVVTELVEIQFYYRDDGSYCTLEGYQQDGRMKVAGILEYNEKGFPIRATGYYDYQHGAFETYYEYDEYWNLKKIDSRVDDYFHTVDYNYRIEDGRVVYCDILDMYSGIDSPVVYSVGYEYNEDGELIRDGFGMGGQLNWREYTYVYEDGEAPSFLPDDLRPFAPLFPWD